MKLIYIAGPYTAKTAAEVHANIQDARRVADAVNRTPGCFAVTPHFLGSGIEDSLPPQGWYDGTMEVMLRCDAVVKTSCWQMSVGAVAEVVKAEEHNIPVFHEANLDQLATWADQ